MIHFDWPATVAILPSSVIAALSVNAGRRLVAQVKNARFARAQSSASTPIVTLIPRAAQELDAAGVARDRILEPDDDARDARRRAPPARTAASGRGGCTARG